MPLKTYPFDNGDYVAFLKNPFGSLAVYSLTDGLVVQTDGVNCTLGVKPPSTLVKARTKLQARLLLVGMNNQTEDPAALAAQVAQTYGLSGAPGYTVEARQGKVLGAKYRLDLAGLPGALLPRNGHRAGQAPRQPGLPRLGPERPAGRPSSRSATATR